MARRKPGPPGAGGELLTVREVADRLKVGEETVRRYVRQGRLRALALAGRSTGYRIEAAELERFLAAGRGVRLPPAVPPPAPGDARRELDRAPSARPP
jgi:excisionase family DNA binding protein